MTESRKGWQKQLYGEDTRVGREDSFDGIDYRMQAAGRVGEGG